MITGTVNAFREAVVRIRVEAASGPEEIDATVDTGFNGYVTLPRTLVSRLALPALAPTQVTLEDGTRVQLDVFEVSLEWFGHTRQVAALAVNDAPLAGMSLLYGHRLTIEVLDGGKVMIEDL